MLKAEKNRLELVGLAMQTIEMDRADFHLRPFEIIMILPCRIRHVRSDVATSDC
jgi:hypothetical protein